MCITFYVRAQIMGVSLFMTSQRDASSSGSPIDVDFRVASSCSPLSVLSAAPFIRDSETHLTVEPERVSQSEQAEPQPGK